MAFSVQIILAVSFLIIGTNARSALKDTEQQTPEVQSNPVAPIEPYEIATYLQLPTETKPAPFAPVPQEPSTYLNLPLRETQAIFNPPKEPSASLSPPQYYENPEVNFYDVAIPSEYLKAPQEGAWNPNNDPIYFYELPASLTKVETPTDKFPKKFNKEVHSKAKPYSAQPKQEIELVPVEGKEWLAKKISVDKKLNNLAKAANRRELEKLQAFSNHKDEQTAEASNLNDIDEGFSNGADHSGYTRGLSADVLTSMGLPSGDGHSRLSFHMVGHDGPHSYKWGYDTGKGHNRQFRFEERDKEGIVKGHYGYYDKHGKLQMVNYDAHPHEGFHAESNTDNS